MGNWSSAEVLAGAYGLVRRARLMEIDWMRRGFVASYFLYKRFYEDPFRRLVQQKPELFLNGDVLDLGANIGYTACLFARAVESSSKVYAFEPDEASYNLLGEVIRRRSLTAAIETLNMAVGSSDGYLDFWHNEQHSADHRVVTGKFRSFHPDASFSKVPVTSVDSFAKARDLRRIAFIKIDVQGYELAVCEGMTETLEKFPELSVCFEFAPQALIELGFDPAKLLEFFRAKRYQFHVLTRETIRTASDNATIERMLDHTGYLDLLCSRRALA